jgi:hypothetical protein
VSGHGQLVFNVWPSYIGFGTTPTEVLPFERRRQIMWRTENGQIVGGATVWAPKGTYTHVLFFHDVTGPPTQARVQTFIQPADDYVVIDPIYNDDSVINDVVHMQGVPR